jgi:hypothetical protein
MSGQATRLFPASLAEWDIGMPLEPPDAVPFRLTVPDQENFCIHVSPPISIPFLILSKNGRFFYKKSRLQAHSFNRGMKGSVAQHPFLGMVRATNLLDNRTYERCSSRW